MKKIYQFNRYLLEKYPTAWNTKLVWMLLASAFIHLMFFGIGYVSHIDPTSLQHTDAINDYFSNGMFFVQLIISVLMIVGWLITMFKNNSFKNFYPTTNRTLFFQFLHYFVILFACTTFYFSYMLGFKTFIKNRYDDISMKQKVETINQGAAFLAQDIEHYTLDNRQYPQVFSNLYCETDVNNVDGSKKYFVYYNRVYQYYSLYSKTSYHKDSLGRFIAPKPEGENPKLLAYKISDGKSVTYFYKKNVEDVSPYIQTTQPSFYNYSRTFHEVNEEETALIRIRHGYAEYSEEVVSTSIVKKQDSLALASNRKVTQLLDRNDSVALEKLLNDFLSVSSEFGIENNLNAKEWTKMVYQPENFEVRYFIKQYKIHSNEEYDENVQEAIIAPAAVDSVATEVVDENGNPISRAVIIKQFNPDLNQQLSPEKYFKNNLTDYYYRDVDLKEFLTNVDEIKATDIFSETVHVFFWIAFALSTFIFSFRVTNLRSLLFSIISAGIITLAVVLIAVLYGYSVRYKNEFFIGYLSLAVSLAILLIPIFALTKVPKLVSSIAIVISLNGFVLLVLLILGLIQEHQVHDCRHSENSCTGILDDWGPWATSTVILISGFVFIFFYTAILRKWKALPE